MIADVRGRSFGGSHGQAQGTVPTGAVSSFCWRQQREAIVSTLALALSKIYWAEGSVPTNLPYLLRRPQREQVYP
jgi:hypothetical protein